MANQQEDEAFNKPAQEEGTFGAHTTGHGDIPITTLCTVCGRPARYMCSLCGAQAQVYYCDPSCQTFDWNSGHKAVCAGMHNSGAAAVRETTLPNTSPAVSSAVSLANASSMASLDNTARGRVRQRRRRVRGRGNVAQVINAETHFMDRIKGFFSRGSSQHHSTHSIQSIPPTIPTPTTLLTPDSHIVVPPRTSSSVENQEHPIMEPLTEEEKLEDLKFYMEQVYLIIKPVLCCIALSILWVKLTTQSSPNFNTGIGETAAPPSTVGSTFGSDDKGNGNAFINALIILGQIVGATIVVVVLFYFNCMKILFGFFILVVTALLGTFGWTLGSELLLSHNLALDQVTFWFFIWNMTAVGVLMIFYKGPLFLQQVYLVLMSSMMAYTLTKLPALTAWILLALLAVWDLIAVLCPFGPLRILVETSQNEEREIPALLYTVMVWMMATPGEPPSTRDQPRGTEPAITPPTPAYTPNARWSRGVESVVSSWTPLSEYGDERNLTDSSAQDVELDVRPSTGTEMIGVNNEVARGHQGNTPTAPTIPAALSAQGCRVTDGESRVPNDSEEEEEEAARGGLKLGLGDFVFYSVLVARAALFDWITTVTCTVAVLTGLNMTIFLLALYQKALPALPISIAFGILFYFISSVTLTPFTNELVRRQDRIFIQGADTWLWVGKNGGGGMIYV
ncbi:hypothetical protein SpCBS45565_g00216 [Spizellomyces sp. 'palustris']|nr:hypothetical protein SpCBS45565_g00216 [Spizellomyces sp. 'palustris']